MTNVLLIGSRGGGGEEVFLRDLADAPPRDVRYTLALDPHGSVPGGRALTVQEVLFNRTLHRLLWPLPGLRAYEVDASVDLVHVHNVPTRLRPATGCPVVYSVGGGSYPHYMETYLGWTPQAVAARYRRARTIYRRFGIRSEIAATEAVDAVVVFSDFAAGWLRRFGVAAEKIHVIPPGFDIPAAAPPTDDAGPCTFLLVGRDPARKGADLAATAVRMLAESGLDVRLQLVGDDAYRAMGDGDRIFGEGPVSRQRLFGEFFPGADVVLVPSRAEGFGFTAVEAMGHGRPVIVSRRDTLPEIVDGAGLQVEPGRADALAEAMAALASDRTRARAMGREGRRRFEEVYARQGVGARWAELYHRLLPRG